MHASDFQSLQALADLLPILQAYEAERGHAGGVFYEYFPDDGPLRRELYPKQMAFFKGGAAYHERLFMKANRVGGTASGAYELTAHLTGLYPHWWEGRRFRGPVDCWISGKNSKTTRDILQNTLLGDFPFSLTSRGMVPSHLVAGEPTRSHGIPGAYESFAVRHVTGGLSRVGLKSYEQGRQSFEGTARHIVWLDEEGDTGHDSIYSECLTRTMVVDDLGERVSGIVYMTFTPLQGLTPFIKSYMEKAVMYSLDGSLTHAENVWADIRSDIQSG